MPANLVFRRKIWGARDNGIPPRSTPGTGGETLSIIGFYSIFLLIKAHLLSTDLDLIN